MTGHWKLSDDVIGGLLAYAPLAGATVAFPGDFPGAFDDVAIRARNPARNTFLGLTVTRPEQNVVAFGLAYRDAKDGATDEDVYTLDLSRKDLTYYGKGRWERAEPQYAGTHRGDKNYLL